MNQPDQITARNARSPQMRPPASPLAIMPWPGPHMPFT